jgi:hypothetical protein
MQPQWRQVPAVRRKLLSAAIAAVACLAAFSDRPLSARTFPVAHPASYSHLQYYCLLQL